MTDRFLSFPVTRVTQPVGTFFAGSVDAYALLEICKFDFRRIADAGGYKEFLGFQRKLDLKRVRSIERYIQTLDAVFPTAIVLSVDEKCASIDTDAAGHSTLKLQGYQDSETVDFRIEYEDIASIIDGQHRMKAFENIKGLEFQVNVAVFVGADDATKADIFSTVNLAQTKVNKSLVYDLFSLQKARSSEKTCHEIVVALDEMKESPFFEKIKRLGSATDGRFGETLSQATVVKGLLPYITDDALADRDIGKRFGFWDPSGPEEVKRRIFRPFFERQQDEKILANVLNYFSAIRDRWPNAWKNTGSGNIINRTNGFNGFMRFLRPVYLYFTNEPTVVSKQQFASIFQKIKLAEHDFNPENFLPGTSGSTKLYRVLMEQSHLDS
ncbi:DGQHR domain-containing protein [Bradyrhizobium sp. NP1]|uniref:DGQHR domain-containing protein n=1 Tax=Bradyrhizobium sp. NP1 TaxID=3049772 RepID=UPI0025A51E6A|nr:DGQHR domain-containing protein [Bradyrhizobium sp. NP1]WJR79644.1 DGQHR domain-containing protein [Bradyrhizobium sp. NP1]